MNFGYARVSTHEQNLDLQIDALCRAGCVRVFTDTCSGSTACADRPELRRLRAQLCAGDVLTVWRLDRLGRNLHDLLAFLELLQAAEAHFASLTEGMDTSTPKGRMIFSVFGALAEYERNLMRERTLAGLAAARARGRKGGRRPKLTGARLRRAQELMRDRTHSVAEIARLTGVSPRTLYRHLTPDGERRADAQEPGAE